MQRSAILRCIFLSAQLGAANNVVYAIKEPGIDANQFLVFLFDGILPDIDESVVTWSLLTEADIETNAFDG